MVRLASEGLRSVGATSPSKSVCSILPLARHWRAGEVFSGFNPGPRLAAKASGGLIGTAPKRLPGLLPPPALRVPEEHREHALLSLACCRVQHSRYPR